MALTTYIPGMAPGKTARNAFLALTYILLSPLLSLLAFIWVPIYIGTDYNGVSAHLSGLPGIEPGGGLKSAVAAFIYIVLANAPLLLQFF